jgi:hypothetical protein
MIKKMNNYDYDHENDCEDGWRQQQDDEEQERNEAGE